MGFVSFQSFFRSSIAWRCTKGSPFFYETAHYLPAFNNDFKRVSSFASLFSVFCNASISISSSTSCTRRSRNTLPVFPRGVASREASGGSSVHRASVHSLPQTSHFFLQNYVIHKPIAVCFSLFASVFMSLLIVINRNTVRRWFRCDFRVITARFVFLFGQP